MAFFPFIESIFYLSLGITFVLIFLIVFHFKNRIESLEKKSFMLTEMYESVLKEFGIIKSFVFSSQNRQNVVLSTPPAYTIPAPYKKIVVLDKVNEEEEDDDSKSAYSASSDSKSSNSVLSEKDLSNVDIDLHLEEDDLDDIPVIHLDDKTYPEKNIDDLDNILNINLDDISHTIQNNNEPIFEHNIEAIDLEESIAPITKPDISTTSSSNINYQKMNVQSLKMLVIQKGLAADPSKMKRAELLKLLEDELNF